MYYMYVFSFIARFPIRIYIFTIISYEKKSLIKQNPYEYYLISDIIATDAFYI